MNVLNKVAEILAGTSIGDIDMGVVSILKSQGLITTENNTICCPYKVESFGEYCFKVFLESPEDLRLGQWAAILFSGKFPTVVIPENIDPFYSDSKLPEFLDFAAEYQHDF